MTRPAVVVSVWALFLSGLAAGLVLWTPTDVVEWIPLAAAAGGAWLVALVLVVRRRARAVVCRVPDFSPGAVVVALGLTALAQGSSLGVWLVYVGGGATLVGLGIVWRETLAMKRTRSDG